MHQPQWQSENGDWNEEEDKKGNYSLPRRQVVFFLPRYLFIPPKFQETMGPSQEENYYVFSSPCPTGDTPCQAHT